MCLAIPGKILTITGEAPLMMAEVDFIGVKRTVCVGAVDAHVGDYVIVHAGTALSVMQPQDALDTINDLKKMASYSETNG